MPEEAALLEVPGGRDDEEEVWNGLVVPGG